MVLFASKIPSTFKSCEPPVTVLANWIVEPFKFIASPDNVTAPV